MNWSILENPLIVLHLQMLVFHRNIDSSNNVSLNKHWPLSSRHWIPSADTGCRDCISSSSSWLVPEDQTMRSSFVHCSIEMKEKKILLLTKWSLWGICFLTGAARKETNISRVSLRFNWIKSKNKSRWCGRSLTYEWDIEVSSRLLIEQICINQLSLQIQFN